VKYAHKSPFRQRLNSGMCKAEYFHMAKGMLKPNNISLKRRTDKLSSAHRSNLSTKIENIKINFTPSQGILQGSIENGDHSKNYASSDSSTVRLVNDSEYSNSVSNSIDGRVSTNRQKVNIQEKYGSRKIRKKIDIDQTLFSKEQSKPSQYNPYEYITYIEINTIPEKCPQDYQLKLLNQDLKTKVTIKPQMVVNNVCKENNPTSPSPTKKMNNGYKDCVNILGVNNENIPDDFSTTMVTLVKSSN
jgi:hypothetical protein